MKRKIITSIVLFVSVFMLNNINVLATDIDLPKEGFVKFISDIDAFESVEKIDYTINNHNGFKSYMSYKKITDKSSLQYELQQNCYTDEEGFRRYNDYYCVAVGTAFDMQIGQHFDIILENNTIIKCIVGDIKADIDTDKTNTFTAQGCCSEFLVETSKLNKTVKTMGDCSFLYEKWNSPCVSFTVYNLNTLFQKGGDNNE